MFSRLSSVSEGTQRTVQAQIYLLAALDVNKLPSVFSLEFALETSPKSYSCEKDFHNTSWRL